MAQVQFYRRETYLCGDGCCTLFGDSDLVTTREVTSEQLERLNKEVDYCNTSYWTDDFDIEGEPEKFHYFNEIA